jgi:O-antigen ligase
VPWTATVRPLPQEHPNGRQYVHFAALWFWLKLGILGLFAYIGILTGGIRLSIQAWRRGREPLLRAFALASMCGIVGVIVLDTTASFTGVDQRFTVLVGVQLGLIAALARPVEGELEPDNG